MIVEQTSSPQLRLVTAPDSAAGSATDVMAGICQAFEQALGWRLEFSAEPIQDQKSLVWSAPVNPGVGAALRLIKVASGQRAAGLPRPVAMRRAIGLAEQLAGLLAELDTLRNGLVESEAELAAEVPVIVRPEPPQRMAERLSSVLRSGAEAVDCQAAGLYLLDGATTSLKLRACWGLPESRLAAPPRPLRGAMADLEALLGHAVVLSEPGMLTYWRAPETCGAAVCVPVSTPSMPLGTLWVYSHMTRDFSDQQTNVLETVAGRLAAELEREVLVADARQSRQERQQLDACATRQLESAPAVVPDVEGWQAAGRAFDLQAPGRTFFDWFAAPQGRLALTLGGAVEPGLPGAFASAQLRSALRAQASVLERASQGLFCAHEALAAVSAGSPGVNAFCGLIDPQRDALRFSTAGATRVWLAEGSTLRPAGEPGSPLGSPSALSAVEFSRRLDPGAACLVCTLSGDDPNPSQWSEVQQTLRGQLPLDPQIDSGRLADRAVEAFRGGLPAADGALLLVRRR